MGGVGWFVSLTGSLVVPPPLVEKTVLSGCWLKASWPYICGSHFPGGSDDKAPAYNAGDPGFNPWVEKISWRRKWQPTPVFLPGKSHGQRSLLDYSPWGRKELDMTERLHFTSLQRKISTYKSDNSKYKRN